MSAGAAGAAPAPYAHVACCVDDSEASRQALERAARLTALAGARLSVVHVARPPVLGGWSRWGPQYQPRFEEEQRWLERLAAGIPGAEPVLLWGPPVRAVCEWAEEAGADLLVAATHGGAAERALLGSFADRLVREAPCPVLLVRPGLRPAGVITAGVDEWGRLSADDGPAASLSGRWSSGHLVLAAVAAWALEGVRRAAATVGSLADGRATAAARPPEGDGEAPLGPVDCVVDVQAGPEPDEDALREMARLLPAGGPPGLALEVRVTVRVNGRVLQG